MCMALQEACPNFILDPCNIRNMPPFRATTGDGLLKRLHKDRQSTILVVDQALKPTPMQVT